MHSTQISVSLGPYITVYNPIFQGSRSVLCVKPISALLTTNAAGAPLSQREAPRHVCSRRRRHTHNTAFWGRGAWARGTWAADHQMLGIGVKRESARRGDAMHHPRGFHRTVASPSRPHALPTRGPTSEGSARGQTLRLRAPGPGQTAGRSERRAKRRVAAASPLCAVGAPVPVPVRHDDAHARGCGPLAKGVGA